MTMPAGSEDATELYPPVMAVASTYGDSENKYRDFLVKGSGSGYVSDASFFWNQPMSDNGFAASLSQNSTSGSPSGSGSSNQSKGGQNQSSAVVSHFGDLRSWRTWGLLYGACGLVMVASFADFW
jgi:hypothetical protein